METQFETKLDLVIDLLNDNNINVHTLLNSYEDTEFLRKVIELDNTWTEEDQTKLERKLSGNEHHKDTRDLKTFAQSLVINWLIEDFAYTILKRHNFNVKRTGGDQNRELLQGSQVKPSADLLIDDKQKLNIEVIASFPYAGGQSFWVDNGFFDLRDNKLKHLLNMSRTETTIVLGILVASKQYFTMKIHDEIETRKESTETNFGNKLTTKVIFPNGRPTTHEAKNLPYTIKNITREKVFTPLDPDNKIGSFMEQYFEMQRGNCIAVVNTDKNILHSKLKVLTNEAQLYYVYYQESQDHDTIAIPQDHIINDYDFGFQFSFNDPTVMYWWQGEVIKHHILYNLKQKKVWEPYVDRKTDTLMIPRRYFPQLQEIKIDKKFLNIL